MRQSDWILLHVLYENKSITKAAEVLYMTQPAITKRLKSLEDEFGIMIAVRSAKGLDFTSQGEYLVKYANRMLNEYNDLKKDIQNDQHELLGTLHIATSSSMARFVLPNLLGQYKRSYPKVEFDVNVEFSFKVSQLVNTRKAQVGFLRGEHLNGCQKFLIRKQQAYIIYFRPFSLDELPLLPRVDFYADPLSSSLIDSWWYEHFHTPPKIAMTVQSAETCCEMVLNGVGYGIFLSEDFFAGKDGLHRIPLYNKQQHPILRNDWMIYRTETLQLDLVSSFVDYAKNYFKCKYVKKELSDE